MFLNNRYYDPTTGTFLSVDPLVNKTGTPYLYAAGNPTTLSDPSGLCAVTQGMHSYDDGKGPCGGGGSHGSCAGKCEPRTVNYSPVTAEVYIPRDDSLMGYLERNMRAMPLPLLVLVSMMSPGELQPLRAPRILEVTDELIDNVRPYDSQLAGVSGVLDEFLKRTQSMAM